MASLLGVVPQPTNPLIFCTMLPTPKWAWMVCWWTQTQFHRSAATATATAISGNSSNWWSFLSANLCISYYGLNKRCPQQPLVTVLIGKEIHTRITHLRIAQQSREEKSKTKEDTWEPLTFIMVGEQIKTKGEEEKVWNMCK